MWVAVGAMDGVGAVLGWDRCECGWRWGLCWGGIGVSGGGGCGWVVRGSELAQPITWQYAFFLPLLISPSAIQKAVAAITAHDSPLAALAFNVTGTKLATASTTVSYSLGCHSLVCWNKAKYMCKLVASFQGEADMGRSHS